MATAIWQCENGQRAPALVHDDTMADTRSVAELLARMPPEAQAIAHAEAQRLGEEIDRNEKAGLTGDVPGLS
jgi:hypothetical protein